MPAAIQAPVILMSQNRADTKRTALAELGFRDHRRAETENQVLTQVLGLPLDEFEARVEAELATALMIDRMARGTSAGAPPTAGR